MSLLNRSLGVSEYLQELAADPSRMALLVIDVQTCFIGDSYDFKRRARRIDKFARAFRESGGQVYNIFFNIGLNDNPTPDFEQYTPDDKDIILAKERCSAFTNFDLNEKLRSGSHSHLLLCGFFFNACLQDTALDAVSLGYKPCLMKDLTDYFFMLPKDAYHDAGIPIAKSGSVSKSLNLKP